MGVTVYTAQGKGAEEAQDHLNSSGCVELRVHSPSYDHLEGVFLISPETAVNLAV